MDLAFSFDSEDFATPAADDAEKWWADELTARGHRGTFHLVAELVRRLKQRGRDDVIDAIARHDIGHHTNYHSIHPTHPEALEGMSLEEAVAWVHRTEATALRTLLETFGRMPVSYCSPGSSWTPATLLAMAASGVKMFCNDSLPVHDAKPYWYCGLLVVRYNIGFDLYFEPGADEEARFKRAFTDAAEQVGDDGLFIAYTHPTRLVTSRFWDEQVAHGKDVRPDDLQPTPLWPEKHQQALKDRCRRLLDWIEAQPNINVVDLKSAYYDWRPGGRPLEDLLGEAGLGVGEEGRLPLDRTDPRSLPVTMFDQMTYDDWPIYPRDFKGARLIEQAKSLVWTSAPARRAEPAPA